MQRRSFLGAICAAVGGLFAGKTAAATPERIRITGKATLLYGHYRLEPVAGDWDGKCKPIVEISVNTLRNARGESTACVFRLGSDGHYRHCRISELQPGDRIISIGVNDGKLWCAESLTVGKGGMFCDQNTDTEGVFIDSPIRDFLKEKGA